MTIEEHLTAARNHRAWAERAFAPNAKANHYEAALRHESLAAALRDRQEQALLNEGKSHD